MGLHRREDRGRAVRDRVRAAARLRPEHAQDRVGLGDRAFDRGGVSQRPGRDREARAALEALRVARVGRHRVTGQQGGVDREPAGRPGAAEDGDPHGRAAGSAVSAASPGVDRARRRVEVAILVPRLDDGTLAVPAEDRDGRCREREQPTRGRGQAQPAGAEDAEQVAVAEEQGIAGDGRGQAALDDPVGAGPDLVDGLTGRPRTGPDRPAGEVGPDVGGQPALEGAVVPFHQVRVWHRLRPEAGDACRVRRAGEGTGQDERERVAVEPAAEGIGLRAPGRGQRDVGPTGVAPETRPLGLAVADQPDLPLGRGLRRRRRPGHLEAPATGSVPGGPSVSSETSGRVDAAGSGVKNSRARQPRIAASAFVGTCEIRVL